MHESFLIRAAAHARHAGGLTRDKRFRNGITDEDVSAVFLAMEAFEMRFTLVPTGRWVPSGGTTIDSMHGINVLRGIGVTETIREMVRTGLANTVPRYGVTRARPARVHLRDPENRSLTICHDPLESLPQGRVRIVDDLALVDCLECELVVATGIVRGL